MEGPAEGWLEEMLRQHQMVQQHQQYYLDQKHRQQQRRQQQQHRQQQHQQRQELFLYRQQLQLHQQYYLQQQHEIFWREQHQKHYHQQQQQQQQQQQHLQHHHLETAKKTSKAQQVEARADREGASAKKSGAPPSSQTTLKPQSLSEYSAMMLFVSRPVCREFLSTQDQQLHDMENGMLQPPQKCEEKKRQLQALQLQQPSALREPEAKSGDDRVARVAGYDIAHARGEHEALPRRQQPIPQTDEKFIVLAQMRLPAGSRDNMLVEEKNSPVVEFDGNGGCCDVDDGGVWRDGANGDEEQEGSQQLKQQQQAPPPLLQQQQELLAPPPQEPWPPPIMAAEHGGSGAGVSGESRLELERKVIFGDGLRDGGGGDAESDTTDGGDWERAGPVLQQSLLGM